MYQSRRWPYHGGSQPPTPCLDWLRDQYGEENGRGEGGESLVAQIIATPIRRRVRRSSGPDRRCSGSSPGGGRDVQVGDEKPGEKELKVAQEDSGAPRMPGQQPRSGRRHRDERDEKRRRAA